MKKLLKSVNEAYGIKYPDSKFKMYINEYTRTIPNVSSTIGIEVRIKYKVDGIFTDHKYVSIEENIPYIYTEFIKVKKKKLKKDIYNYVIRAILLGKGDLSLSNLLEDIKDNTDSQ